MSEENTPVRHIGIHGHDFEIDQPYKEGHQLTGPEAAAFNQLYEENVRNNLREKIKVMTTEGKTLDDMQAIVDEYCDKYEVGGRKGGRRIHDPLQREIRNIAIEAIKPLIAKQGTTWANVSAEDREKVIVRYLAKYGEQAMAAAQARLDALKTVTAQTLDF